MKHDYLWDKTGPSDPEIAQLEAKLNTLQASGERPAWLREFTSTLETAPRKPAALRAVAAPPIIAPRRRFAFTVPALSVAAAVLCALVIGSWFTLSAPTTPIQETARLEAPAPIVTVATPSTAAAKPTPTVAQSVKVKAVTPSTIVPVRAKLRRSVVVPQFIAYHRPSRPINKQVAPDIELTAAEARRAKDDLLLALHVINQQLNLAQKNLEGRTLLLPEIINSTDTANN